jgi:hypothetical protein
MADRPPSFTINTPPKTPSGSGSTGNPPPKTGRRAATPRPLANSTDVRKAEAVLSSGYTLIGNGLEIFGATEALAKWEVNSAKLRATNADALINSPKLAHQIATIGEGGGAVTLIIAHLAAIVPVALIARTEIQTRIAESGRGRHASEEPPEPGSTFDSFLANAGPDIPSPPGANMPGGYDPSVFIPGI